MEGRVGRVWRLSRPPPAASATCPGELLPCCPVHGGLQVRHARHGASLRYVQRGLTGQHGYLVPRILFPARILFTIPTGAPPRSRSEAPGESHTLYFPPKSNPTLPSGPRTRAASNSLPDFDWKPFITPVRAFASNSFTCATVSFLPAISFQTMNRQPSL